MRLSNISFPLPLEQGVPVEDTTGDDNTVPPPTDAALADGCRDEADVCDNITL